MTSTLKKAIFFSALAAVALELALPDAAFGLVGRTVVTAMACYAVYLGIRAHRSRRSLRSHLTHPDPWALLALAAVLHLGSEIAGFVAATPPVVLRSLLGLATVTLTGYGLVEMMRQRFGDRVGDHVFEGIITAGTLSLLAWVAIVEPVLQASGHPVAAGVSGAVGITVSLALASLAVHLLASFGNRPLAFTELALSQMFPVAASLLSFVAGHGGHDAFGLVGAALPILGVAFVGSAALEPSMARYEEPAGPAGARLGRLRLAALAAPVVLGPVTLGLCLTGVLSLSPVAVTTYTVALSFLVVGHLIAMVQARASSTHWASHDKLTGLPNRALFRERTAQALERARKAGTSVSVLYLDLDRFKHINDSMGHEAGDQLLEQVARRILACVDSGDTVARLGGDEFAVLLPSIDDHRVPGKLARRLLKTFSTPFNLRPRPVFMTPSIGIALSAGTATLETLLTQADTAMYRAKESGRNNFAVWSKEMNEAAKQRLMLETHLHSAISNDELRLVYQPKVELATGKVVGVEALIRWHHPKLGVISPTVFIHLAEETGLINQIGDWVLWTACAQARAWYDSGFTELTMAVNLSSRQFQSESIADKVAKVLRQTQLDPELLELELTESVAMSGDATTLETLDELRAMGVKCSIDDFGTGYSNLSYLSRFPIDTLKIDKSFIDQIDQSGGDAAIVVAVIAMAHGLGLKVIAEGVETPEQAAFLVQHGCDEMQGFLFSKPLYVPDLESLLMLENVAGGQGRLRIAEPSARRIERPVHERVDEPPALPVSPVADDQYD